MKLKSTILEWKEFLISDKDDKELIEYFCKILEEKPDLECFAKINNLLKEIRNDLHEELKQYIDRYIALTALQETLTAHKSENIYKN